MSKSERCIGGNWQRRMFAYLHKLDHTKFGLLEAVDSADARRHLGRAYHVRATWLTLEECGDQMLNRDRKWEIVSSIFLDSKSSAYVGT